MEDTSNVHREEFARILAAGNSYRIFLESTINPELPELLEAAAGASKRKVPQPEAEPAPMTTKRKIVLDGKRQGLRKKRNL